MLRVLTLAFAATLFATFAPTAQAVPPVCIAPAGEVHETIGPITVHSYGINCTTVEVDETWRPSCIDHSRSITVDSTHSVTTRADCTAEVELFEGIICVGGWHTTTVRDVGPVRIIVHGCGQPGPDPL